MTAVTCWADGCTTEVDDYAAWSRYFAAYLCTMHLRLARVAASAARTDTLELDGANIQGSLL